MKSYPVNKQCVPGRLVIELMAAGVPSPGFSAPMNADLITAPSATVFAGDAADDATVNAAIAAHDGTIRKPRTLLAIYTDIAALNGGQKTNVWADLSSGSPAKYLTDAGADAASIACLDWAVRFSGLGVAALSDAKLRLAAIYCRDNPKYLTHPAFDATVNIAGDQPA